MSEPKLPQATLGKTGIITSILGFGTAGLGLDYGLGDDSPPSYRDGLSLLFTAWREGVRFFDTAPTYGPAEAMLGKCRLGLSDGGTLATKVSPLMRIGTPDSPLACPGSLFETAILSARISQLNLGQPVLPLVQIHSPVVEQIQDDRLARILKRDGLARRVGVSVYDFWEALTAIQTGLYDTIQVPFNLLDQRMAKEVFPAAQAAGVGIILRSALLKGALTGRGMTINPKWDKQIELIHACQRARDLLGEGSWNILANKALRFALFAVPNAVTIVGIKTTDELFQAVHALEAGPLSEEELEIANSLAVNDPEIVDPRRWPVP